MKLPLKLKQAQIDIWTCLICQIMIGNVLTDQVSIEYVSIEPRE